MDIGVIFIYAIHTVCCWQTFCGSAQNAEVAIILNSKRLSSATSDVNCARTSTDDADDDDDESRLQRSYILSDTDTVAGKVST